MARYVFQDAFERFITALDDALLLDAEAGHVNHRKWKQRGSGGLNVESRAMYRAIAVISVAAWEDFNEQLVRAGHEYLMRTAARPVPAELGQWFPADKLQTPSSANVRKLYWTYFGRNWSGAGAWPVRDHAVSGVHGRPSVSMTRASKKCIPCFAAVDR